MRGSRVVASILLLALAATVQASTLPDTLKGEFLFYSQGYAYVRCDSTAGAHDSIWCDRLGTALRTSAPVWEFLADQAGVLRQGEALKLFRLALPKRAAQVSLYGGYDAWDPVQMRTPAAWALSPLFHRTLFKTTRDGSLQGDLAREWWWRGADLFVRVDTSARFGDGNVVDAYAVKTSLERFLWYQRDVPEYSWQFCMAGVDAYRKGRTSEVVGLVPRGRDTLQFNLARPDYSLPERLSAPATAIVRWVRLTNEAPVVSTCGYYAAIDSGEAADVFQGRPDHGGSLVISRERADRIWMGREDDKPCVNSSVPAPMLVVLRPLRGLPDGMLSFLHWAIDRKSAVSEKDRSRSYFGGPLPVYWGGDAPPTPFEFDYGQARAARQRLVGRPSLSIAYAPGLEEEAQYLVTALKAWDIKSSYASSPNAADVRLELWDFESFAADAQLEHAFHESELPASDSLVDRLWAARGTADEIERRALYQSLVSRLDLRNLYVVMLQYDALVTVCGDHPPDCSRDVWGRYVGPFFNTDAQP